MEERRKTKKGLWKKIKKLFGEVVLHRECTDEQTILSERNSPSPHNDLYNEEVSFINATPQEESLLEDTIALKAFKKCVSIIEKKDLSDLFKIIEHNVFTSEERIHYFTKHASGKLHSWWTGLGIKPATWEDLKIWLIEDLESLKSIEEKDSYYYNLGFPNI